MREWQGGLARSGGSWGHGAVEGIGPDMAPSAGEQEVRQRARSRSLTSCVGWAVHRLERVRAG